MALINRKSVLKWAYIQIVILMFIIPLFRLNQYSILRNTVIELGAQSAPHAWMINYTFYLLAVGSVIAGWHFFEGFVLHRIILLMFGISIVLMSVFNTAPIGMNVSFNMEEAYIHEYFSGTTGILFVVLSTAASIVMDQPQKRLMAAIAGLLSLTLIILTIESQALAGIWQRLFIIISFGWMIYSFK